MGPDPGSVVVDSRLRADGMHALRIIDASVFPVMTSGNTKAPVIMTGENGADLVPADMSAGGGARPYQDELEAEPGT
ncbi:MAG: hypothetical protein KJZ80_01120 [Hyphomicrobiaceae bacterium]|nr:hypothetical protein [Hyphomicrobiaceae bacterium]